MDRWILTVGVVTFGLLRGGVFLTIRECRQMKPGQTDGIRQTMMACDYQPK